MEPPYDRLDGVLSTTSGYTGGHVENPSYRQVTAGGTGHFEAVRVVLRPGQFLPHRDLRPRRRPAAGCRALQGGPGGQ